MKKLVVIVVLIALVWIVKLSFDVMQISAQQQQLSQSLHLAEKTNANLNDQLVALQRRNYTQDAPEQPAVSSAVQQEDAIQPVDMVAQQLDLVEFSLQQQQFHYATEKLANLDRELNEYALAPALKQSLHQVIQQDQKQIQQFITTRDAQYQQVSQLLQQLDQQLKQQAQQPELNPADVDDRYFWQKWLSIESAKQPATQLMQRQIILKEAQLRLLLARQVFMQGQYVQYQQEVNDIIQLLQQLPDQKAQQLVQQLEKIKNLNIVPTPSLKTRALLGAV
jgi:arsenate reductase-like glutaredoxin family protein